MPSCMGMLGHLKLRFHRNIWLFISEEQLCNFSCFMIFDGDTLYEIHIIRDPNDNEIHMLRDPHNKRSK